MNKEIENKIYDWLASFFSTNTNQVKIALGEQIATLYLLIWPVMEQKVFSGFMKYQCIGPTVKRFDKYYSELDVEKMVMHFHARYQDKTKYRHLYQKKRSVEVDSILDKNISELSEYEKLFLLMYVVYRYRNNIFHGSKGVLAWKQFSTEIEMCIQFMMKLVDCYDTHEKDCI